MFLNNYTRFDARLERGLVFDEIAAFSVGVAIWYRVESDGELVQSDAPHELEQTPPDVRPSLLWKGTTVSAFGHVQGPKRPPFVTSVSLMVASATRRLAVFGERRWQKRRGSFAASEPAKFDRLPLAWSYAYGGTEVLPAGWDPATGLPHPGGPVPYLLNPSGIGFIHDLTGAEGRELPPIESPTSLVRHPADRPTPAGFAPCPSLMALRLASIATPGEQRTARSELERHLTLRHHVAPTGVFDPLTMGERVVISGLGELCAFAVPACPAELRLPGAPARCRLRDVHVDADRRVARLTWTFGRRFDREAAPRRLQLVEAP